MCFKAHCRAIATHLHPPTVEAMEAVGRSSPAVVFNQGEYVVMLMLPDNDAAREIINLYIPH
ncbi:MAG: hypothetical protein FWE32_01125 [Oscillospiraceae bacterium]|nr:hypothetical protein [Oscillospiraceae bacterium]